MVVLLFTEAIKFDERLETAYFKPSGTAVLLKCSATGKPQPDISWRFERTRLPQSKCFKMAREKGESPAYIGCTPLLLYRLYFM